MIFSKKNIILSVLIAIIIVVDILYFFMFFKNDNSNIQLQKTDEEIISVLNKNQDCKNYMQKNPDFKIQKKTVLTKESILEGQNGQKFKEIYIGLELQNNRYIMVNLINNAGNSGFIAVIDFEKNEVLKAYGMLLFNSSVKAK